MLSKWRKDPLNEPLNRRKRAGTQPHLPSLKPQSLNIIPSYTLPIHTTVPLPHTSGFDPLQAAFSPSLATAGLTTTPPNQVVSPKRIYPRHADWRCAGTVI